MRRVRQIESGFGRALLALGAFLVATVFVALPLIFLNSNLVWGEANQYGRVPIPGRKVVHLPAGGVEVAVAAALPGRGNETPELLLPELTLTMSAHHGEAPTVAEDIGSSTNADDNEVDTQRRVWKLEVPHEGNYLATIKGDFTGYGVNAQAWFGHEPSPLHGWQVFLVAMLIVLVVGAVYFAVGAIRRRRKGMGGSGPVEDPAISDADFSAERTKSEKDLQREREGAV